MGDISLRLCNPGPMATSSPDSLPLDRFDELAVFVEIAEAGSLTAAARRLGVPKSTVSRALSRLEGALGTALVRRLSRGPALTEQGRQLAALAAPHVAGLRDAALALGRAVEEPYGTLRVTAPVDIAQVVLGPILPAFLARYPSVGIEVDLTHRYVDVVGEGFDAALRVSTRPLPSSTLLARKIAPIDIGLYAGTTYLARREPPRRLEDLALHEHVLFQPQRGRAKLVLEGRGRGEVTVQGRIGGNDFFFLREAIVAGAGIGPLPWFVARSEIESGRLQRVLPSIGLKSASVFWVQPPTRPMPRKLEAFRDFVLEHAARLLVPPPENPRVAARK
jgi:DNA-binding transcriptional LysR family regulator